MDNLNSVYGAGWQAAMKRTLEQELKERGITPKPDDDQIILGPQLRSRAGAFIFAAALVAIAGFFLYLIVWEMTPESPGEFCPSPFQACERTR